jgi:hypothetical protein
MKIDYQVKSKVEELMSLHTKLNELTDYPLLTSYFDTTYPSMFMIKSITVGKQSVSFRITECDGGGARSWCLGSLEDFRYYAKYYKKALKEAIKAEDDQLILAEYSGTEAEE